LLFVRQAVLYAIHTYHRQAVPYALHTHIGRLCRVLYTPTIGRLCCMLYTHIGRLCRMLYTPIWLYTPTIGRLCHMLYTIHTYHMLHPIPCYTYLPHASPHTVCDQLVSIFVTALLLPTCPDWHLRQRYLLQQHTLLFSRFKTVQWLYVGLARTICICKCITYFGGDFIRYTVIYGVRHLYIPIRFWPTLFIWSHVVHENSGPLDCIWHIMYDVLAMFFTCNCVCVCVCMCVCARVWMCVSSAQQPMVLLKDGFKPGSSLSRAKAGNCTLDCNSPDSLSLFLCCFSHPTCLTHWLILYHTHSSRLPRLSSPGMGSLLNHLAEHHNIKTRKCHLQ